MRTLLLLFVLLPGDPRGDFRIVLLHTSDLHGQTRQLPRIAAWIKAQREKETAAGAHVLVVDSGDIFQGTPEGDFTGGRIVVDAMNAIGYDAMCLGNHDFDRGPEALAALADAAKFPFLGANIKNPPPHIAPSITFFDGRIEILGLVPAGLKRLTQARVPWSIEDESTCLEKHRWAAPIHVLLTHLGIDEDRKLPSKGVSAILGGHTHSKSAELLKSGARLLHSGSHGDQVGRLEIVIDASGTIRTFKPEIFDVPDVEDGGVAELVRRGSAAILKKMDVRVAELKCDLPRGGAAYDGVSTPLGNHLCDVLIDATHADAAILLRSGIRSALFAGPIRLRHLYEVSPFPDTIATFEMTGKNLRHALESAFGDDGRLLVEIAGFEFEYKPASKRGHRIRGTSLEPDRVYRVATTSFLADGEGMFEGADKLIETKTLLLEAHRDFLSRHSPFEVAYRNRITRAGR